MSYQGYVYGVKLEEKEIDKAALLADVRECNLGREQIAAQLFLPWDLDPDYDSPWMIGKEELERIITDRLGKIVKRPIEFEVHGFF